MPERPRDRLGRPLPWEAVGYPGVEQRAHIESAEAVRLAQAYLDEGLPFHAHEVLEQRWRCCPSRERDLWRALAQWAAAATHAARGNAEGAQRLALRARAGIDGYDEPLPPGTAHLIGCLSSGSTAPARVDGTGLGAT